VRPSIPFDPRAHRLPARGVVARIGRLAIDAVALWGAALLTLVTAVGSLATPGKAAGGVARRVALSQVFFTGVQGLPTVTATALIIGATFMVQIAVAAPSMPGEVIGQFLVAVVLRELAPLVTAIIVASRSGTAIATELGNMKANLEVLGLASLGIDPGRYIVLPRIVGVVLGVVVLTVYFGVLSLVGALLVAALLGSPSVYAVQHGVAETLTAVDLVLLTVKAGGCGLLVGWLCCHFGLQVRGSSTEVPTMTGRAVIRSVFGCVLFNFSVTLGYYGLRGTLLQ
jgi:phospholipid/cholesterol/gamma-HCH transport system permease protein